MSKTVAIVGGGIGGLSAAHHLSGAGVESITVYESSDAVGGKAKSQYLTTAGGTRYPGEHGFRFFPHFYRHLLATLREIDVSGGTIWDRLVGPEKAAIAYKGRPLLEVDRPVRVEPSFQFVKTTVEILMRREVSIVEATRFASRLLQFATSCSERRWYEYDKISWADFTGATSRPYSPEFEDVVIRASQNLSAMRARESSAATIGAITLQLLFVFSEDEKSDALLHGPTQEMWLEDWRAFLEKRGVKFRFGKHLKEFVFDRPAGRIAGLRFRDDRKVTEADYYVSSIPLERLVEVLSPAMMEVDDALGELPSFARDAVGNMTGLQFFLKRQCPITKGHVHYPGTPFALTSISQGQFWNPKPDARPGTPELLDVLSVIISDWDTEGTEGLAAKDYTSADALAAEVWRQMVAALPPGDTLRDSDILGTHVDQNIALAPFVNSSPLLVHPCDQRRRRPEAETAISNFYLAADFVRTNTDLATMEGADEAGRRATRAILKDMRIDRSRWPAVEELDEGPLFKIAKFRDYAMWKAGLPHWMEFTNQPWKQRWDGFWESLTRFDLKDRPTFTPDQRRGIAPDEDLDFDALSDWERFLLRLRD